MSKLLRSLSGCSMGSGRGLGLLLSAVLGSAPACGGDRQVVLVSVSNRPDDLSGFGVYYSVDSAPGKTLIGGLKEEKGNLPNYDLFGISLDKSLSGTLSVDVYAHQKSLPCIRFRGRVEVALTGAPKQEAQIDLTQVMTTGCDTSFPKGTLPKNPKIWAKALDDMWIVGDEGRILHWNGAYFAEIPLPDSIAEAPAIPRTVNLRAVGGNGPSDVWIVGDQGTALHWDGDQLQRVKTFKLKSFADLPQEDQKLLEITSITVDAGGAKMAAWVPNTSTTTAMYIGFGQAGSKEIQLYDLRSDTDLNPKPAVSRPTAIACAAPSLGDCWIVGEGGLLIGRRGSSAGMGYMSYATTTWTPPKPNLRAVSIETDPANTNQYDLFGVGDQGAYFQATRQVFTVMGQSTVIEATPIPPLWSSKIGAAAQLKAVVPLGFTTSLSVLGGAGGGGAYYLAKAGTLQAPNEVQAVADPNLQGPISSMTRIGQQILILSESGNILARAVP